MIDHKIVSYLRRQFSKTLNFIENLFLVYPQYKINKVRNQRANSDTCGYHACKFIIDRINKIKYKDASGFSNILKSESNIRKLKEKVKAFGYM